MTDQMIGKTTTHTQKNPRNAGKWIIYLVLALGSFSMLFPFFWMILTSLKTQGEAMGIPPTFWPVAATLDNYKMVLKSLPFMTLYWNTFLLMLFRVLCAVAFSSMAGYAFAKINFPLKGLFFGLVLTQMMLPTQIFIIPQYQMLASLGQLNTIFALVFPGLVSAFGTFFLRQTYMGIPDDLMEAAKLDGCNQWTTFVRIMLPLTTTSMVALALFTALFAYSDLMWPLIANTDLKMMTLSSGLSTLRGQFTTHYPRLMAGSVLAMWPMLVLYLLFQKHFIEGIALTGTKA